MTPDRWRQVTEVFHAALARDTPARAQLLDEMCTGDAELRAEVDALLAAHRDGEGFGEEPLPLTQELIAPRLRRGDALGPYRVETLIGSGGMGEVYRARDTRLDRDVAIKVLALPVAGDPALRQRLAREAKALATLSHPHICPVFDVGEQEGVDYLVMEYLEGETLAMRLARGALPLGEALRCAVQVADALDKAHRQGIVHRDLKPGNVMLTKAGAKLLDFGIAKLRAGTSTEARTAGVNPGADAPLTRHGTVLGTLNYMAPEQLSGEEADARTDIFAFGAVLYEMVTGRKAFEGDTRRAVLAAILEREPATVSTLQASAPPALDHLVRACLAKDPDQRWQSAGDIGRYLTWILGEGSRPSGTMPAGAAGRPARASRLPWIVLAAVGVFAVVLGLRWTTREKTPVQLLQGALPAPPGAVLQLRNGFALSPDGSRLAFVARNTSGVGKLWVRSLAALQASPLDGTEGAASPFWSPDGRNIAFFADQRLKRIPAAGGAAQVLAGDILEQKGGTWSPDGRIVYGPDYRAGLLEVPAGGGPARAFTTLDAGAGELSHRWPRFLPDGRAVLFLVQTAEGGAKDDRSRIDVVDARGARHELLSVNASAAYAPPGHLLFWRGGSLFAQPLDATRFVLRGEPVLVAAGVDLNLSEWAAFSAAEAGTLVYASVLPARLEWRDRAGRRLSVAAPEGDYSYAALSPDGGRIAYVAGNTAVRVLDLARGTHTRLTSEDVDHYSPAWAPQGDWVAYFANKPGGTGGQIVRCRPSGLDPEALYSSAGPVRNLSWSPNGGSIAFEESENVFLLDVESRAARARIRTAAFEGEPRFSPDGRWLAYVSDESGRLEVYVVPAFEGSEKWPISSHGGHTPRWGASGRELFFQGMDEELKVVTVGTGKEPRFGVPEPVFALPGGDPWGPVYDVGPDGRVLVTAQQAPSDTQSLKLVVNWLRLLEPPPR